MGIPNNKINMNNKKKILLENSNENLSLNINDIDDENLEKIYYLFNRHYKDGDNKGHVKITKLTDTYSLTMEYGYKEIEYIDLKYRNIEDLKNQN